MGTIVVTKTKTVPPCPDQTCNNVFVKAVSSPPTLVELELTFALVCVTCMDWW